MKSIRKAFTLAEMLITMAIIGVVAVLTIPPLANDITQRSLNSAANVFNRKLGEALSVMNSQNVLSGLQTTENFVSELSKYMKVLKTCSTPTECFENKIVVGADEDEIDISEMSTASDINPSSSWGTNIMGVQFANGINALIAYNPRCKSEPYNNQAIQVSAKDLENNGKNSTVEVKTNCLAILYDVNGYEQPNKFTSSDDIRGLNVSLGGVAGTCTQVGSYCISDFGKNYDFISCTDGAKNSTDNNIKDLYDAYCAGTSSATDYWAGAKKKCADEGMYLPNQGEMYAFYTVYHGQEGVPTSGKYYTSSSLSSYGIAIDFSGPKGNDYVGKGEKLPILCFQ